MSRKEKSLGLTVQFQVIKGAIWSMATAGRGFLRVEEFRVLPSCKSGKGRGLHLCRVFQDADCVPFVEFSFLFTIILVRAEDEFSERIGTKHTKCLEFESQQ